MRFREWFRPPRHALLIFLGVAAVSGVALGWLGLLLLEQDKSVEIQRRQERLDDAADRAVAVMQRSIADLEGRLAQSAMAGTPPAGVTLVAASENGMVATPGLLYYPEPARLPEAAVGTFAEAERLEFTARAGATQIYERLAGAVDAPVRAGALTRLARTERRLRRMIEAERVYASLAKVEHAAVEGLPAGLIAREGLIGLYKETGRTADFAREAALLENDLRNGRWQLTQQQYEYYSSEAAAETGHATPPDADGLARTKAFDLVWSRRTDGPIPARRLISVDGSPVLVIWHQTGEEISTALAGPRYLKSLGAEAIPGGLHWGIADAEGRTVMGETPPAREIAVRAASMTQLPWTLQIFAPGGGPSLISPRRQLLLWVFAVLAVVLSAGAYFILRAISREMRTARLQSDFVAAVSHEFRSPLSSMAQISEMLARDRIPTDDLRRKSYDVLVRETERLRRLVEGLLDFGRFEAGAASYRFEELEVCSFVRGIVSEFQERVTAQGYVIELSEPEDELPMRADREALGRAIWNLLDNAVKYSPECRTVWVEVEAGAGRRVSIMVRDQGLGIPAHEQREIFDRFVRGADSKALRIRGTGIGLAMVRHIVQAHGGEISVASEPGRGSRFTMVLNIAGGTS